MTEPKARKARGYECLLELTAPLVMKNSTYLDRPFVPLAMALRSMLAETEEKLTTAAPAEKARLQERAEVMREWIKPKSTMSVST